jgi:hypothetical protein
MDTSLASARKRPNNGEFLSSDNILYSLSHSWVLVGYEKSCVQSHGQQSYSKN